MGSGEYHDEIEKLQQKGIVPLMAQPTFNLCNILRKK